jgi:hypothetical protein
MYVHLNPRATQKNLVCSVTVQLFRRHHPCERDPLRTRLPGAGRAPAGPRADRPAKGSQRASVSAPALCRGLCRNPAIPARIGPLLAVSLGHTQKAANMRETRMNTASPYHLVSSGFFWSNVAP